MLGQVASLFVTDEALVVSHVLGPVSGREVDPINIHGIGIPSRLGGSCHLSQGSVTVPSAPELPESYHILVELSCLFKLLFTFPACFLLPFQECGGVHHDGKLLCGLHSQILPSSAHSSVAQGHVELLSVLMTMM